MKHVSLVTLSTFKKHVNLVNGFTLTKLVWGLLWNVVQNEIRFGILEVTICIMSMMGRMTFCYAM